MQRLISGIHSISRSVCHGQHLRCSFSSFDHGINRASHLRRNGEWLEHPEVKEQAEYVMFMGLRPVAENVSTASLDMRLARFRHEEVEHLMVGEEQGALCIFLGIENSRPLFLLALKERNNKLLDNSSRFVLDGYISMKPLVDRPLWFYGRSMVAWNYNHPHCGYCGARTRSENMGHKRVCTNSSCSSLKSRSSGDHALTHPRSDPATLVTVTQGRQLLLARKDGFPPRYLSCVAGFVEPGETIEQAVAREVFEEVGLTAASVRYVMSEPWPFDSVIMLGCAVEIDPEDRTPITLDAEELSYAAWFTAEEAQLMVDHKHPDWILPPAKFLANRLIVHWLSSLKADSS